MDIQQPPLLTVRRADRFFTRLAGLLLSRPLLQGEGLLITPCASVHTFFMRFPIDVVFLDGAGRIQKMVHVLKPWRTASNRGSWQTLELAAGEARRLGLAVGQSLATRLARQQGREER